MKTKTAKAPKVNPVTPEEWQKEIKDILETVLPKGCFIEVISYLGVFSIPCVKIFFAASDYKINGLNYQFPQDCSLLLRVDKLELSVQHFGGNGGQSLSRKIDKEHPREKYNYCARVKVPFRTPKPEPDKILAAVYRFVENYCQLIREWRPVLMYREHCDNYEHFGEFLDNYSPEVMQVLRSYPPEPQV